MHPAPGPEEVNWPALWFTHSQRVLRGWLVTPFIVILVLLPVSLLTSAATQLDQAFCDYTNVRIQHWDWYCRSGSAMARFIKALLTGFVPTLLVQLWQGMCMPRLVFLCAQSEARHLSLSILDRRMGEIYL